MSENHKNLLMWQHPSGVGGSQPNFAAIIYAGRPTTCRKNGEDRSCTFWENWTRRTSTNSKQFWQSGLPELITDGAIWQKTKFPTFLLLELYVYLASFWSYDVKTKLQKKTKIGCELLWQHPLRDQKSRFSSFSYSHSGTEWWKPHENPSSGSWDNSADRNC